VSRPAPDTLADATPARRAGQLLITEIFHSIQGEARDVGWPTVFVRLTGCPLRCAYCDTEYAFEGGERWSLDRVLETVAGMAARHVTVTGGEPLAQPGCLGLLSRLCDEGYKVSLETSGALDLSAVDARVVKVMDLKAPGSGESDRNRWENLEHLNERDQIKFVLRDRADYEWARATVADRGLAALNEVLFSPSYGELEPRALAEWILEDRLAVRLQVQLHKLLWGEQPGR
jgi:7-carboxy-7-deazaguanine synthase